MLKKYIEADSSAIRNLTLDSKKELKFQKKVDKLYKRFKKKIIKASLRGEGSVLIACPTFSSMGVFKAVILRLRKEHFNTIEVTSPLSDGVIVTWGRLGDDIDVIY